MAIYDFVRAGAESLHLRRPAALAGAVGAIDDRASIPKLGELEVQSEECVVLLEGHRAVGVLGPGRHVLTPENAAFLADIATVGLEGEATYPLRACFVAIDEVDGFPLDVTLPPSGDVGAVRLSGVAALRVFDPTAFATAWAASAPTHAAADDWLASRIAQTVLLTMPGASLLALGESAPAALLAKLAAAPSLGTIGVRVTAVRRLVARGVGGADDTNPGTPALELGPPPERASAQMPVAPSAGSANADATLETSPVTTPAPETPVAEAAPATPATVMTCAGCGAHVPAGRFCRECGRPTSTEVRCASCSEVLSKAARFCHACGARTKTTS